MKKAGLYVHIPFCLRKCRYCDFYSITDRSWIDAFLSALKREIVLRATTDATCCDSIYMGGGTPSVLSSAQIGSVLDTLFRWFRIDSDCEITVEANPGTVDRRRLVEMRWLGVHRLQLGIQSFQDDVLRFLGRVHTAREAEHTLREALAIDGWKVGADLMYNIPIRDRDALVEDLEKMIGIRPPHLSCYSLSVEEGTDLHAAAQRRDFQPLLEEEEAERFGIVSDMLTDGGYIQYEVSNFALDGSRADGADNRSRHNRKYWRGIPYLGFGPGAHSFVPPVRSWNDRDIDGYIRALSEERLPPGGSEVLDREKRMLEAVLLGLRTAEGIDRLDFEESFGIDLDPIIRRMLDTGDWLHLMRYDGNHVRLTRNGWAVLDPIVYYLVDRLIDSG